MISFYFIFYLSLAFNKVKCNMILTPKEFHTVDFSSFTQEHNVNYLASIDDLNIYKTDIDNYNKYKNTFRYLFDVEKEQSYTVNPIVHNLNEENSFLLFVQEPGKLEFTIEESVPWHLDRLSKRHLPLNGSYAYNTPGSCHKNSNVEIHTYIVDTGVDVNHHEFEGRAKFLENFTDDNKDYDCNSHGTFCSSQIGGLKAGVCKDSKLFAVKVLNCEGSGSTSGVIAGMEYVFKRHLQNEKKNPKVRSIMSMSLGGGKSLAMNRAVEKMVKMSDTFYIVVASGNENQDAKNTSPASARGIFTANAMDKNDQRAYFSNYGSSTDIYSPGVSNYGAVLDNKYAIESGTSFSTPILAGIMNHFLDMYPDLNMKRLKEKILNDATKDTIKGNPKNTPNLMVFLERND